MPAAEAREQVAWLGAVLSSRGMPRLLLERHLLIMREELAAAVPQKLRSYSILTRCATDLRKRRLKAIPERRAAAIAATFSEAAPKLWVRRIPEMGSLLVAAVADERNGIERAVVSMEEWAYDAERFPARWIEAVHAAVDAARAI